MRRRIIEFNEIKAYCDIFNERGHKGFRELVNPFFWWNHEKPGFVADSVRAYVDEGLVVVLDVDGFTVNNLLVFALCPQKKILKKLLDILKYYDTVIYNCDFRDRYRNITKKLGGSRHDGAFSNGRFYYSAKGEEAWSRLGVQL